MKQNIQKALHALLALMLILTSVSIPVQANEDPAAAAEQNIALNKPTNTSGGQGERAVDGDLSTYWDGGVYPGELLVDLEGYYDVSRITVIPYYGGSRYYHYEVYVSDDGFTYDLVGRKDSDEPQTSEGETYEFASRTVKYVKVVMTYNSANPSIHINELQVFGTENTDYEPPETPAEDPNDPLNIAYGKPTRSTANSGFTQLAVDGQNSTAWSGEDYPKYVDVDLMRNYDITSINVCMPQDGTQYAYTLYGSVDGVHFTRIAETKMSTPQENGDTYTFEQPLTYRVIRVNVTGNSKGEGANSTVSEIRVYGSESAEPLVPPRESLELTSYEDWLYDHAQVDVDALKDENGHYDIKDTYDEEDVITEVRGVVSRILGERYNDWFTFALSPSENGKDYYEISDEDGKIRIVGNEGVSLTAGLNHYLKYYCNVHVSQQTSQVNMPDTIPAVGSVIRKESPYEIRYAYNYCTLSYTMAFWGYDEWNHPYYLGRNCNQSIADGRSSVTTTGEAAKLQMSADRTEIAADGKDLSYVTVDVTDQNGNIVPDADNRVTFNVEGDGVLVGVDNGSSPDHDSYLADNRKAFSGKVLAIVQSTKTGGSFTVTATADGLESAAATVTTYSVSDGTPEEKEIDSFWMSKTYYVKTGNIPVLPTTIETRYTDGSKESKAVTWDAIGEEMVQQSGNFNVQGQIEGHQVTVNVNVIDEVGGLLNYSTSTPVGTVPILPESRPAVLTDGTILTASFGVNWDDISAGQFAEEGTVTVNGTADVLGDEIPVSATIRVQTEQITVGSSVSGKVMNLTQSIPEGEQSDTLSAIVDGSTTISDNTSGGANPTAWSNWQSSQNGNSKAEITFEYATQQRLGQIVMHFAKDSGSMRYPDAGTTEILVSEDGTNWNKLAVTETIGEESGRVKPYTYDFTPTTATFIKFKLTNASASTGTGWKPCTALTEIELKVAQGSFVSNTTAKLEEVIVNGNPVPESALAQGSYSTPAIFAEVEAKAADNASVTILPTFNNIKKIIVESEDHNTRNVFEIRLGEETEETPESGDRDYPIRRLTAFAESEYNGSGTEGPAEYVLDEDEGTHWHTNWSTNDAQDVEKRWIGLELEEPAVLDAFRYFPRGGNMNGFVSEYKVQYKLNQKDEWTDIAGGTWDRTLEWKIAEFDEPVEAKYVRLVGIHTYAKSENDAHMAVAELRVREADKRVDISAEDSQITVSVPEQTEVAKADEQNPVYRLVEV